MPASVNEATRSDVLIIGGGVIGSAIACFLSRMGGFDGRITVIERDPSYTQASTALSAASIRQQFSNPLNVAMSRFGVEFIRDFETLFAPPLTPVSLNLRENGYLFLAANARQAEILRANHKVQRAGGADVALLSPEALGARYPMLNTGDLTLASMGQSGEGWFDNMGLLNGLHDLAKHNGVNYLKDEVVSLTRDGARITAAHLASGARLSAGMFVNAAGPRAARVARMAGIKLPVEPRKRTTFVFQTPEPPPPDMPLMVDASGVYVRPEGAFWMGAVAPDPDPAAEWEDFEPDHTDFETRLWPALAARSRVFEAIRLRRMWAGHYAYNRFDQNAILGPHPECRNLCFANGFSGHGLQQAPAVGRGIAEWIAYGDYRTLDLTPLGFARVLEGRPYRETSIV